MLLEPCACLKLSSCLSSGDHRHILTPARPAQLGWRFDELADQGNQIFYSTHSGNFVDVSRFDRICLVERCPDPRGNLCTDVRQISAEVALAERQRLYPDIKMGIPAMRERYRNIYGLEHNEAFFARKIVVVEGATEEYSLPIYAEHLGYDFDANGVSIVNARGKLSLDAFYQLYTAFGIPTYVIFETTAEGRRGTSRGTHGSYRCWARRLCGNPMAL